MRGNKNHPALYMQSTRKVVLASGSRYRQGLLGKILPKFESQAPEIDESAQADEGPIQLAKRLAKSKAQALASSYPDSLIIGSDQVAMLNGQQLHKPGDRNRCVEQLLASSGRCVEFHTSVCVYDAMTGVLHEGMDTTKVFFKTLSIQQIERYVDREQPYDCAGGFKSEGLGIALFDHMETRDPNALVGLPLLILCNLLEKSGVSVV